MALPHVSMVGNLTSDPELRFTQSGKPVTTFRIACNDRRKDQTTGEWVDGDTTFLDVTSWNNAEAISDQLKRGSRVIVNGQLSQRSYTAKDGTERTVYEVKADEVALVVRTYGTQPQATPAASTPADDVWTTTPVTTWGSDTAPF